MSAQVGKIEFQIKVDGKELELTQKQVNALTSALKRTEETGDGAGKTVAKGANTAGYAVTNLGRIFQDSSMFAFSLQSGILAVSNNIPPMIESMNMAKEANGGFLGGLKAIGQNLIGPAGLAMMAASIIPTALIFMSNGLKKTTEEIKKVSDETKKMISVLNSVGNVGFSVEQMRAIIANYEAMVKKQKELNLAITAVEQSAKSRAKFEQEAAFYKAQEAKIAEFLRDINKADIDAIREVLKTEEAKIRTHERLVELGGVELQQKKEIAKLTDDEFEKELQRIRERNPEDPDLDARMKALAEREKATKIVMQQELNDDFERENIRHYEVNKKAYEEDAAANKKQNDRIWNDTQNHYDRLAKERAEGMAQAKADAQQMRQVSAMVASLMVDGMAAIITGGQGKLKEALKGSLLTLLSYLERAVILGEANGLVSVLFGDVSAIPKMVAIVAALEGAKLAVSSFREGDEVGETGNGLRSQPSRKQVEGGEFIFSNPQVTALGVQMLRDLAAQSGKGPSQSLRDLGRRGQNTVTVTRPIAINLNGKTFYTEMRKEEISLQKRKF